MSISELLAGFTDAQLSDAIAANRAILNTLKMPAACKSLARALLPALHAEAGRRCAKIFNLRRLH